MLVEYCYRSYHSIYHVVSLDMVHLLFVKKKKDEKIPIKKKKEKKKESKRKFLFKLSAKEEGIRIIGIFQKFNRFLEMNPPITFQITQSRIQDRKISLYH